MEYDRRCSSPADLNPEGAELPRPVPEGLTQVVGDVEDERARVVGLAHDLLDPERVVAVVPRDGFVAHGAAEGPQAGVGVGQATDFISRY